MLLFFGFHARHFLQVDIAKLYRVGDVILARVSALGDSITSYNLSTAEDQLGAR